MEFMGYGIDLCDHNDNLPGLLAFAKKYTPDVYGEICEWLKDEKEEECTRWNTEDAVKWWFNDYMYDGFAGVAAYITAVINEQEGTQFRCFDVNCDCVYFPQEYPWKLNEKMRGMTEEEFCAVIKKYISQLTDEVYEISEMTMYDD